MFILQENSNFSLKKEYKKITLFLSSAVSKMANLKR